jgi:hypothetical protein
MGLGVLGGPVDPGIIPPAVSFFILFSAATTLAWVKFGPAAFSPSSSMAPLIQP